MSKRSKTIGWKQGLGFDCLLLTHLDKSGQQTVLSNNGTHTAHRWTLDGELLNAFVCESQVDYIAKIDSDTIATCDSVGGITLWNVRNGFVRCRLRTAKKARITSLIKLRGEDALVGGEMGKGSLLLWNLNDKDNTAFVHNAHDMMIFSLIELKKQNYEESVVVSSSWDASIKFWKISSNRKTRASENITAIDDTTSRFNCECIKTFKGHSDAVWELVVDDEERVLGSCSSDHTVKLWDLATGKILLTYRNHRHGVRRLSMLWQGSSHNNRNSSNDSDNNWLNDLYYCSGSLDHTVQIWTGKGHRLGSYNIESMVNSMTVINSGAILVAAPMGYALLLRLPNSLVEICCSVLGDLPYHELTKLKAVLPPDLYQVCVMYCRGCVVPLSNL
eukprot:TRINITY_DN2057_c0_g1_i1.p1 TRINITY_DN2057_c0_g1~~TRINITY_DN2057_c0_g1_i1.p1  ORF type:complete len:389 (-),score=64.05 TRINITY_DN2057_c0_g1_i1:1349-2515(-)